MLRAFLAIPLLFLTGCATLTADSDQEIFISTKTEGASCTLTNEAGSWEIDRTPGSVKVKRDYSPLRVRCAHEGDGRLMTATIEPKTRGRAYGNILLLGVPALIDAKTGDGYEYDPAQLHLSYPKE